jgi:FLVCR family MFS transporter
MTSVNGGDGAAEARESLLSSEPGAPPEAPAPRGVVLQRLYVAALFSTFAFMQGLCWAIPGPLSAAYATLYNAQAAEVQLLINLGPLVYLPLSLPFALWMDKKNGVRYATIVGITLVTLGQAARTLAHDSSDFSEAMLYISYTLNAAAGPVAMGAVGRISEGFFPPSQRATATAVMAEANLLGVAGAQLFGPLIVQQAVFAEMQAYNYSLLAICLLMQVCVLLYFPAAPATPPSASAAAVEKHEAAHPMNVGALWAAVRALSTSPSFMVLACAYGLSTGMFGSWATVLSINLSSCDPLYVGWLSFAMTVAGGIGGIFAGRVVDRLRRPKAMLVALLLASGILFSAFAVICSGWFEGFPICDADGSPDRGMSVLFALGMLGGLALNSTIPIFYELALETTYPLPEATTLIWLTNMNNVACILFLSIPQTWTGINWLFSGTVVVFALLTQAVFVEKQKRYAVDVGGSLEDEEHGPKGKGLLGVE